MTTAEYQAQYTLWDEFLQRWPLEKLRTMTLAEYNQAGSQDAFCYWLESKLDNMGSIWGGSAFKFGIYSRKDQSDKPDGRGASYSDNYAWYTKYGANETEAFAHVRDIVAGVAEAAAKGDLKAIEDADLGQATKWKIAFHYQNRDKPCVIDVFMMRSLLVFLGLSDQKLSMMDLQKAALARRSEGEGILEFGSRVWVTWVAKAIDIWKLSHGNDGSFSASEREVLAEQRRAIIHKDTGANQAKNFREVADDALFYLCYGNEVRLLGRFSGPAKVSDKGADWLERPYEVLKVSQSSAPYSDSSKKWTPAGNSTFWEVPKEQLSAFEKTLLQPYFGIGLEEIMETQPVENRAKNDVDRNSPCGGGAAQPHPLRPAGHRQDLSLGGRGGGDHRRTDDTGADGHSRRLCGCQAEIRRLSCRRADRVRDLPPVLHLPGFRGWHSSLDRGCECGLFSRTWPVEAPCRSCGRELARVATEGG